MTYSPSRRTKKKTKPVLVKIHLSPDMHQRLKAHAAAGNQSVSAAVEALVRDAVPDYARLFKEPRLLED